MAFAAWLDEPKLLRDLVCPELLPLPVHQRLGSDLILHQALSSQADGAVLAEGGGALQVRVSYSLQREPSVLRNPVAKATRASKQFLAHNLPVSFYTDSMRPFSKRHNFLRKSSWNPVTSETSPYANHFQWTRAWPSKSGFLIVLLG